MLLRRCTSTHTISRTRVPGDGIAIKKEAPRRRRRRRRGRRRRRTTTITRGTKERKRRHDAEYDAMVTRAETSLISQKGRGERCRRDSVEQFVTVDRGARTKASAILSRALRGNAKGGRTVHRRRGDATGRESCTRSSLVRAHCLSPSLLPPS